MRKAVLLAGVLLAAALWVAPAGASEPPPPPPEGAALRLDLEQAVQRAVETSPRLRKGQSRVAEAGFQVDQAYVPAYPTLSLAGGYTRINPTIVAPITRPPAEIVVADNYNFTLTLQQAVYTFGRLEWAAEAAELGRRSAEAGLASTRSGVVEEATLLYRDCLARDEQVRVAEEALEANRLALADSENLVAQGVAAPFDVIRNRSDVLQAEQDLLRAKNERSLAYSRLAVYLDLPGPPVLEDPPDSPAPPDDPAEGLQRALAGRPELLALRFGADAARARVRLAAAQDNPLLSVQTDYTRRNATAFTRDFQWDAGVRLSLPLFDGGQTAALTGQAEEAARQVEADLVEAERGVRVEVQSLFLDLHTAWNQVKVAQQKVVELTEARRLANLRYQNGISTNLERQDAEAAYTAGRAGLVYARFGYAASWTRWVRATVLETEIALPEEPTHAR